MKVRFVAATPFFAAAALTVGGMGTGIRTDIGSATQN